jgi:hypothetical protein
LGGYGAHAEQVVIAQLMSREPGAPPCSAKISAHACFALGVAATSTQAA